MTTLRSRATYVVLIVILVLVAFGLLRLLSFIDEHYLN